MNKKAVYVLVVTISLLFVFGFLYYQNKQKQEINTLPGETVDDLSDIVIPPEFTDDLDKGYFIRFEDNYVVYKRDTTEIKMLLNESLLLTQNNQEATKSDFQSGDIVSLRIIETFPGVREAAIITRYP